MSKSLLEKIEHQLNAAEKIGQLCCAFTTEETEQLRRLIVLAYQLRTTAVVDDEFPVVRDRFDTLLMKVVGE